MVIHSQIKSTNMQQVRSFIGATSLALLLFSCQKNTNYPTKEEQLLENKSAQSFRLDGTQKVFIQSVIKLNPKTGNVTLPLFKGRHKGKDVWYIVTEASDKQNAAKLGINFAPKMANALGTKAVQNARLINRKNEQPLPASSDLSSWDAVLVFEGGVDFSPERIVVPSSPDGFPPSSFQAGAVGDDKYSPLVTFGDGVVFNASHVANASGLHDAVISIDYNKREVTLDQFFGFYEFERVLYLHQDASIELVAAVEGSTWAPNLNAAPGLGSNDPATSARSAIIPIVNGERGVGNPNRQGLESALLGQGDPLNVTQEEPGEEDGVVLYSPVWDIHLVKWTDAAIAAGKRRLLTDADEVAGLFATGYLISPNSGVANPSLQGMRALGAISNCPLTANLGPIQ
jgi:hypothetical protein